MLQKKIIIEKNSSSINFHINSFRSDLYKKRAKLGDFDEKKFSMKEVGILQDFIVFFLYQASSQKSTEKHTLYFLSIYSFLSIV